MFVLANFGVANFSFGCSICTTGCCVVEPKASQDKQHQVREPVYFCNSCQFVCMRDLNFPQEFHFCIH